MLLSSPLVSYSMRLFPDRTVTPIVPFISAVVAGVRVLSWPLVVLTVPAVGSLVGSSPA